MKDVFNRELAVGDIVICFPYNPTNKYIIIKTVTIVSEESFGVDSHKKLTGECLILKRKNGDVYFNSEGNNFKGWNTNYEEKFIL